MAVDVGEYASPVDVGNRALQHCGVRRMDPTEGFEEDSKNAAAVAFVYNKLLKAELRRNLWRFSIKYAPLRPIDGNTRIISPLLYSSLTNYFVGSIVADAQGILWISNISDNVGAAPGGTLPGTAQAWDQYFGPLTVHLWDSATSYLAGELVYKTAGDGTANVYLSLQNGNSDDPAVNAAWDDSVTYGKDALVTYLSVVYQSLIDFNLNQTPNVSPAAWDATPSRSTSSTKWLKLDAVLRELIFPYPIGTGPATDLSTRNIYRLPAGYLRQAPQDPKAGAVSFLGAPSGLGYSDWDYEGDYIKTRESGVIVLRFGAMITNVYAMDAMFCEGLAARIGLAVCEELTQGIGKKQGIASEYVKYMAEARIVNGIETGATMPAEDDFITCRY